MVRARIVPFPKRARALDVDSRAPEPSDAELVRRVRAGDAAAEQALFLKHARYILALSFRLVGDHTEAEDVLQDTFLDAIAHLRRPVEPASLRSWLAGIAVHKVHRRFRRRKLQALLGIARATDDAVLEASVDPEASPEVRVELALLDSALARLPDVDRAAWVLRYVEGYGLDDVARLCRCSLATVKRRIARAQAVVLVHVEVGDLDDG